jgi:hypothetical protein
MMMIDVFVLVCVCVYLCLDKVCMSCIFMTQ